jgi:hypothetical protein
MGDRTDAQQRWMPKSILVFAGEGRPPIDIAKCLVDDQDELGSLVNKKNVIKFPVDVYPPRFDDRNVIESAVKIAVSEADNINQTLFATAPHDTYPCTTLACDMAYTYRVPKDGATEIQKNVYENRENLPRLEKDGTRQDRMINKKKANRLNGQSLPQRTFTEKPPKEERCPFRIRLLLDPGHCWYISPWSGCRCHKFHTKLPPGEKRRRFDTCTEKKRRMPLFMHSRGLLVLQPALSGRRPVTISRSHRFDTTKSPLRFKLVKFHHLLLALS